MTERVQKSEQISSYRTIIKATSLFGGVQVYQILIQIIKSKFIAILLGPAGVGVLGLYQSAIDMIKQLTSFGLSQSAVRDVSEANGTCDMAHITRTITVVHRLVWLTGLLGSLVVILVSPFLSQLTFGDNTYILSFVILSVILLLDQLCAGQKVILQGTRRLKDLAKASAIGVTVGLLACIPIFYWLGIKGIVPTLILNSLIALLLSWYYSKKIKIERISLSFREVLAEGGVMLKLGIALSFGSLLTAASAYILRGYIRSVGGTDEVGVFTAGYSIMSTYVGMVFAALSTDYYPRLAAVNNDEKECRDLVNYQGEIATLILMPLLIICMVFMPVIIKILYSEKFLGASIYTIWAAAGMIFKLGSWVIAYQFIAKGDSKVFIFNEASCCAYMLILNIFGYILFGLEGLGVSFVLGYLLYYLQVLFVSKRKYDYRMSSAFCRLFLISLFINACALCIVLTIDGMMKYLLGSIVIVISLSISLIGIRQRIGSINYFKRKKHE